MTTIRNARKDEASQIATLIMTAMTDECCAYFHGSSHTKEDFHELITLLVGEEHTQYSYQNAICAVCDDGVIGIGDDDVIGMGDDNRIIGVSVSYDGALLHSLRQAFIDGARRAFDRDFSDMADETAPGELYLDSLAVLPSYRHQGIATRLLKATKEKALKMNLPLGLLVDANNPKAEKLYTETGFSYIDANTWGGHEMKHLQW
jgi:ribosomal protein S18 acetylase RimI-like enzyme